MLFWRLIIGVGLACLTIGLAWADFHSTRPGLALCPLALLGTLAGAGEMVRLFEAGPRHGAGEPRYAPSRYVVGAGATLTVLVSLAPIVWTDYADSGPLGHLGWVALGLTLSLMMAVVVELVRFRRPGVATLRLALAVLSIAYVGGLMGFVCQLRLLAGGPWGDDGRWGLVALVSALATAKCADVGAFFVGRSLGRRRMTPLLSPGKTWEGAAGGAALAVVAALVCLGPVAHACGCRSGAPPAAWAAGAVAYGLAIFLSATAGDLAISMLKRDSGLKDSSTWLPGLGGVLDLLDSVLLSAPVALVAWLLRIVGP